MIMAAAYNAILPRPFDRRQHNEVRLGIILSQERLGTHSSAGGEILARPRPFGGHSLRRCELTTDSDFSLATSPAHSGSPVNPADGAIQATADRTIGSSDPGPRDPGPAAALLSSAKRKAKPGLDLILGGFAIKEGDWVSVRATSKRLKGCVIRYQAP
jgi:hypothetical protein